MASQHRLLLLSSKHIRWQQGGPLHVPAVAAATSVQNIYGPGGLSLSSLNCLRLHPNTIYCLFPTNPPGSNGHAVCTPSSVHLRRICTTVPAVTGRSPSAQEIYGGLEEPDGLGGLVQLRGGGPCPADTRLAAEKAGAWSEALSLHEQVHIPPSFKLPVVSVVVHLSSFSIHGQDPQSWIFLPRILTLCTS